jgi:hypothetical protein
LVLYETLWVILVEDRARESSMLSPEEKLRLLSMVDILEPLSREEIKELSLRVPDTYYQRGQLLYTPKERSEALFVVKKGRVRIYRVGPDGREFTLTVVGAGTVFGEMSLTAQRLENAYAEAMERVVVCKMRKHDLERLVLDKPQVGLKVMSVLKEWAARVLASGVKPAMDFEIGFYKLQQGSGGNSTEARCVTLVRVGPSPYALHMVTSRADTRYFGMSYHCGNYESRIAEEYEVRRQQSERNYKG